MPFTVSHVAAVVPALGRSGRLPAAALVVGSMAPDYPWFLTRGRTATLSHSLLGVVTVDLAVGVLAVVVWRLWVQAPVRDLVPRAVGERLAPPPGLRVRELPWVALAVVLGALSHVVWDALTHVGRWGTEPLPWLREPHLGVAGWLWAQGVSSVVGLAVVVAFGVLALARTVPDASGLRSTAAERRAAWVVVAVATVVGAGLGRAWNPGPPVYEVYGVVTVGGAALAAGVLLGCAGWWLRASRPAVVADRAG